MAAVKRLSKPGMSLVTPLLARATAVSAGVMNLAVKVWSHCTSAALNDCTFCICV